jgi:hypothetical protein
LEILKGRCAFRYPIVDRRIILKWILKKQGDAEWIHLAQDRVQFSTLESGNEFFEPINGGGGKS